MNIEEVDIKYKNRFNNLAAHPLQSWEWGDFRLKTGLMVIRLGNFKNNILWETAQVTLHPIPFTSYKIGYFPKGGILSKEMMEKLVEIGKKHHCIFIKIEPNIEKSKFIFKTKNVKFTIVPSPHPLFTRYTFWLDLTKSEEEILKNMHPKTRYNIKIARKNNVKVTINNSPRAFETYLQLLEETTKRQKFYAHNKKYHCLMWETLKPSGIAHLIKADYGFNGKTHTLASWILFKFNNALYYPYGASSVKFKNVMASNLIMWEAIRFGKKLGATVFDLWGALGPEPSPNDPWWGFHRFKLGYNPKLVELAGSYDLVINRKLYLLYNTSYQLRQIFLKIKSNF